MPATLTTAYISIGANRSSSGSACSSSGIFAYAADNTVALWDSVSRAVHGRERTDTSRTARAGYTPRSWATRAM